MLIRGLASALLLGALLAAGAPGPEAPLSSGETFVTAESPTNTTAQVVQARGVLLGGQRLALASADDAGACSAACRNTTDCSWFNWCGSQVSMRCDLHVVQCIWSHRRYTGVAAPLGCPPASFRPPDVRSPHMCAGWLP